MRIACITANIGGIDEQPKFVSQSVACDHHYFTEDNLPFPLPNLNNRLKGKYIKTKMHKFLPDYDLYVWLDGSVDCNSTDFIKDIVERLQGKDIAIMLHPERQTVFEEIEYIQQKMGEGKEYLTSRYANEPFVQESEFYKSLPYIDWTLYACTVFARWNNKKMNEAFDEWWDKCIEFTNFDQTQFTYVKNRYKLNVSTLNWQEMFEKYLTRKRHIK